MESCVWAPMKSEQLSLQCCRIGGSSGRAMWPRSAHFLVLPKALPSRAYPFPKRTNWTRSPRPFRP